MSSTCRALALLATGCAVETPGIRVEVVVGAPTTLAPESDDGVAWAVEAATLGVASVGLVPCDDGELAGVPDATMPVDAALDLLAEGPVTTIPVPPGAWCAVRLVPQVLDGCDPTCAWWARLGPEGTPHEVAGLGTAPPPLPLPGPLDVGRAHRYARIELRADPATWLDGLPPAPSDEALAEAVGDRLAATLVVREAP